jgi:SepF-like predicted cell division protein (DUF552 family)
MELRPMLDEEKIQAELESLREKNKNLERVIEKLRSSEKELKYERILMDALMDNIPDSIYFKDRQCRLVKVSHITTQVLEFKKKTLIIFSRWIKVSALKGQRTRRDQDWD